MPHLVVNGMFQSTKKRGVSVAPALGTETMDWGYLLHVRVLKLNPAKRSLAMRQK